MRKDFVQTKIWKFIDRLSASRIIYFIFFLTFVPSALYWFITNYTALGWIGNANYRATDPFESLYFSIITETTLGYGDISPFGWCRVVACIQVVGGLVLAGLAVAKLTSAPDKEIRMLADKIVGVWIEPCLMLDNRRMVSLTIFSITENGYIRAAGENYRSDGFPIGTWIGHLVDYDDNKVRFKYDNTQSSTEYFAEGLITNQFIEGKSGKWERHHSSSVDFVGKFTVIFEGFRANDEEIEIINGANIQKRRQLIKDYAFKYFETEKNVIISEP